MVIAIWPRPIGIFFVVFMTGLSTEAVFEVDEGDTGKSAGTIPGPCGTFRLPSRLPGIHFVFAHGCVVASLE